MNINATLFVQMLSFLLFVAFTKRYVWPPIVNAMKLRQDKILQGLAEAEQARNKLAEANREVIEMLKQSRKQANDITQQANQQADIIINDAKKEAKAQAENMMKQANLDIDIAYQSARKALIQQVAGLVHEGTKTVIGEAMNETINHDLIEKAIANVKEA